MIKVVDLPLRARKLAQTKLALLWAAVERLDTRTLEDVQVRELCEAAGISEASFFNYFPKKSDLLVYFVQIWTLDVAWHALRSGAPTTARVAITRIFDATAEQVALHPGVMAEVLAVQARMTAPPALVDVPLAERVVAFPDRPGIEDVPALGLDSLLPDLLARAVREGELPEKTDIRAALLGLAAIFFGVPITLRRIDPGAVGPAYRAQLAIYWAGLEAVGRGEKASRAPRGRSSKSTRR